MTPEQYGESVVHTLKFFPASSAEEVERRLANLVAGAVRRAVKEEREARHDTKAIRRGGAGDGQEGSDQPLQKDEVGLGG